MLKYVWPPNLCMNIFQVYNFVTLKKKNGTIIGKVAVTWDARLAWDFFDNSLFLSVS